MKGYITINESAKHPSSCNCCEIQDDTPKLWEVQFTFRSHVDSVKLCEMHLKELKQEIDLALFSNLVEQNER